MIGTTRAVSSSAETYAAPGRVEHPPMSIMAAPALTDDFTYASAVGSVLCMDPSEKESGVMLRVAMI